MNLMLPHAQRVVTPLEKLLVAALQRDSLATLSFTDPWGSLVASGAKQYETRSWSTSYRGVLAIHVAKNLSGDEDALCNDEPFCSALQQAGFVADPRRTHNGWGLPLGCVVALAWLEDVTRITPAFENQITEPERSFGNFAAGRAAWQFSCVYRLQTPVPAKGALGLRQWTPTDDCWQELQTGLETEQRQYVEPR